MIKERKKEKKVTMESNEKVEETLETIGSTGVIFWKVYKLFFYDVSDNTKKGGAGNGGCTTGRTTASVNRLTEVVTRLS